MADSIDNRSAGMLRDLVEPLVGAVLDLTFESGDELRTCGDADVVRVRDHVQLPAHLVMVLDNRLRAVVVRVFEQVGVLLSRLFDSAGQYLGKIIYRLLEFRLELAKVAKNLFVQRIRKNVSSVAIPSGKPPSNAFTVQGTVSIAPEIVPGRAKNFWGQLQDDWIDQSLRKAHPLISGVERSRRCRSGLFVLDDAAPSLAIHFDKHGLF